MTGWSVNRIIMTAICLLLMHSALKGQEEREYIRKGNRLYEKSEFAGSEGMYRRAQAQERSTYDSGFNLGDALYKQGRFSEAANEFSRVANETDTLKQAQSLYNLGNSLLKDKKFEESIKAYINSLKLNPDNLEAKYNLAYAQDQLKKQQEQQKQQQQQQDQQKDQKDQKQDENKDDQNKKDQEKNNDQQQNQQDQQGQDQQQQPAISREDAKRLLDALSANEKDTQEKVQRDKAVKAKVRVIKNW